MRLNIRSAVLGIILSSMLLILGCHEKTPVVPPSDRCSQDLFPVSPIERLAIIYRNGDSGGLIQMFSRGLEIPQTRFFPQEEEGCHAEPWSVEDFIDVHRRIFAPEDSHSPPVPVDLWVTSISITLTQASIFEEVEAYYQSATNPRGLSRDEWFVSEGLYAVAILLDLQGAVDYQTVGRARFVLAENLAKDSCDPGKFLILEWHELADPGAVGLGRLSWSELLDLYRVTQSRAFCAARNPEELIDNLARSYREEYPEHFEALLASDIDLPEFAFHLEPSLGGSWGFDEEVRIHERMFTPEKIPSGETPVAAVYWLDRISIMLLPERAFQEYPDLYESPQNPNGLSPNRWKLYDAIYSSDALFDTQGELDFQVTGRAHFVVVEDLQQQVGEQGKFQILTWRDLGAQVKTSSVQEISWSEIKRVYN